MTAICRSLAMHSLIFTLGVINNFTYKGWSLNVIVNATIGGQSVQ